MAELVNQLNLTPVQRKRLDAAADILTNRPEQIDFLHTVQCQCGILPRVPLC